VSDVVVIDPVWFVDDVDPSAKQRERNYEPTECWMLPLHIKMDAPQIVANVFVRALMFVVVLTFRDAIKHTMVFIVPAQDTGVMWVWIVAIIHVMTVLVLLFVLHKYKLIDPKTM
jgi:hypothetical protein